MRKALLGLGLLLMAASASAQAPGGGGPKPKEIPQQAIDAVEKAKASDHKSAAAPAFALPASVDPANVWLLDLSSGGRVTIILRPDVAPKHVERIRTLTERGFYNGTVFHRVIEGFMAQGGDPTGTGTGSSDLPNLPAEFNDLPHLRGAVAMARAGEKDSANCQFYIVFQPAMKLDHNYTVIGRVVSGMQWVDKIERGEPPANPTKILQASFASDNKPAPAFTPIPAGALSPGAIPTLPGGPPPSSLPTPTLTPKPTAPAGPAPKP